jgi:hypothetical protein
MKYTKFFAGYINTQGSPNLQPAQFKQLMNLIHLEGQLAAIDKIIEKLKNIDSSHKYEMFKTPILKQIDEVSKGLSPSELLRSWMEQ